jgi:alpha-tubulin suppressor-like RCC1 family protein
MGQNYYAELGINSKEPQSFPTQEMTGSQWAVLPSTQDISSFDSSMGAIKKDGTLWLWGTYYDTTTYAHRSSPAQISVGGTWTALSLYSPAGLAVKSDGTLWGWGSVMLSSTGGNSSPIQIGTDTNWKYVFKNQYISCAIKQDDTAYLWGRDFGYGLFGNNTALTTWVSSPSQTITGSWKMMTGISSMYGIRTDGTLWSWGYNGQGALGLNDTIHRSSPTQIAGSYVYVSSNYNAVIAVKTDGTLWGWGESNLVKPPYDGVTWYQRSSSPVQLHFGGTTWTKALLTSSESAIALKSDGTIWTWGRNIYGRSGTSTGLRQPIYVYNYISPIQAAYGSWTDIYGNVSSNFGLNG